jgi:hypothetical protein
VIDLTSWGRTRNLLPALPILFPSLSKNGILSKDSYSFCRADCAIEVVVEVVFEVVEGLALSEDEDEEEEAVLPPAAAGMPFTSAEAVAVAVEDVAVAVARPIDSA